MRRLFLIALSLTILLPLVAVLLAFAAVSSQAQCAGASAGPGSTPGVPTSLLAIYEQAAGSYELGASGWAYLAAINQIESNFDQSTLPGVHSGANADGAAGPLQIGVGGAAGNTWARYQVDAPGGPTPPSVYNETDAVYAAANYLHASGAPGDWQAAIYAYNHAGWYVAQVQQLALAAAAYALAPSAISPPASARRDQRLLPPTPPASMPSAAIGAHVDDIGASVARGEPGRPRPRRAVHRRRTARVEP